MRQVDGVDVPGDLFSIRHTVEITEACILQAEAAARSHRLRVGSAQFIGKYCDPVARLDYYLLDDIIQRDRREDLFDGAAQVGQYDISVLLIKEMYYKSRSTLTRSYSISPSTSSWPRQSCETCKSSPLL